MNLVYASSDFTGLGAENVTLSDINVTSETSGGASANSTNGVVVSTLNTLNDYTSGTVDAGTVTVLRGDAADLNTAYAANTAGTISNLGNEAVTTTDTSLAAATLSTLDGYTSGVVNAASITTLTGTIAAVNTVYAADTAGTIDNLGNEAVTLSDTALTDASTLVTLNSNTTGTINADTLSTVSGALSVVKSIYDLSLIHI